MKIPFNEDEIFNRIYQKECNEFSWVENKLGLRKPNIYTTEELALEYKKNINTKGLGKTFKVFKFDYILLSIFFIILIGMLINTLFYSKNGEGLTHIIVFIFIAVIVGFIVVKFDPTRNLNIILTDDEISINEFKYQWGNIYKTYIVSRPVGEVYSYFLILALDTGVIDRYEFTGLM